MAETSFPKVVYSSEEKITYPFRFFDRETGALGLSEATIKYSSKKNNIEIERSRIAKIYLLKLGDIFDLKMFVAFFIILVFLADALFMWINLFFFPGHKIFIFITQTIILSYGMFFLIFLNKSRWVLIEYFYDDEILMRKAFFSIPGWAGVNGGTQTIFQAIRQ